MEFKLITGEVLSGVILDTLKEEEKLVDTWYAFVPTENLLPWLKAEKQNDLVSMKKYERTIDINRIIGVSMVNENSFGAVG